jgi:hypothetical protein
MKFYRLLLIIPLMILLGCNDYSLQDPFIAPNGLYGFKDADGKIRIKPKYQEARSFNEDFASVKLNSKWGFIDKTGNVVIPPKYSDVGYFSEGLAQVRLGGKIGDWAAECFVDKYGNEYWDMTEDQARQKMKER